MSRDHGRQGAIGSLSIDLELTLGGQTRQGLERLESVTAGLLELLDQHWIRATWGVSDPALSAAREAILGSKACHEIAVLGESIWLGNGTTYSRLAHEFERRFEGARKAGIPISTLILRSIDHLDLNLLLEHHITAIRGPGLPPSCPLASQNWQVRFGIWQAPSPVLVPLSGAWWQADPWAFRQILRGAVRKATPLHLVLDAGKMVALPDFGLPAVEMLLQRLAKSRERGELTLVPLGELARQNLRFRSSQPSRSVLAA